ncbi:hypothetical protein NECAME_09790 [Necator americanus]|uniref:Uncharacterized protein n=1 Tax=Necator americanus TaxID=51031 RepID=W2TCY1_NECAM|nr:hypothetical protein NECAME_09790 [Necator americanus]ETN79454.1 hypothetical protein NECAME_09790 [Necator americanus]
MTLDNFERSEQKSVVESETERMNFSDKKCKIFKGCNMYISNLLAVRLPCRSTQTRVRVWNSEHTFNF